MTENQTSSGTENFAKRFLLITGYSSIAVAIIFFAITFLGYKSRIKNTHTWKKTECIVKTRGYLFLSGSSYRKTSNTKKYYWRIYYQYDFDGKEYTSKKYNLLDYGLYIGTASSYARQEEYEEKIKKIVDENSEPYPEGSKHICYVNPDKPEKALLILVKPTFLNTFRFLLRKIWQLAICAVLIFIGVILVKSGRFLKNLN